MQLRRQQLLAQRNRLLPDQAVSAANDELSRVAYDESGNMIGECDSLGNAVQEHVWFDGALVAVLSGTSTVNYVHKVFADLVTLNFESLFKGR